jgi:hypothetical protein
MKQTLRVKIKHPLRQLSKENWLKYGKKKYRIESLFGNIKNKANSVFKVKRWTILWNFYMILIYVFLFILSVLIFRIIFLIFGTGSLKELELGITLGIILMIVHINV